MKESTKSKAKYQDLESEIGADFCLLGKAFQHFISSSLDSNRPLFEGIVGTKFEPLHIIGRT